MKHTQKEPQTINLYTHREAVRSHIMHSQSGKYGFVTNRILVEFVGRVSLSLFLSSFDANDILQIANVMESHTFPLFSILYQVLYSRQ